MHATMGWEHAQNKRVLTIETLRYLVSLEDDLFVLRVAVLAQHKKTFIATDEVGCILGNMISCGVDWYMQNRFAVEFPPWA